VDGYRSAFRGTSAYLLTLWMLTKLVPWVAQADPTPGGFPDLRQVSPGQVDTGGVVPITPSRVHRVSVAVITRDVLDRYSSKVRGHRSRLNSEERGVHVYQKNTTKGWVPTTDLG